MFPVQTESFGSNTEGKINVCVRKWLQMWRTFAAMVIDAGGWAGNFQGQTVGPLERVTVSDEEGPRLSFLQCCYSC